MAGFSMRAIQGAGVTWTVTLAFPAGTGMQGTETLVATIGTGNGLPALLTVVPTWIAGQSPGLFTQIDIALTATQTASLSPGFYTVIVSLADNSASLAYGQLEVVSSPSGLPVLDTLVQPSNCIGLIPEITNNSDKIASLPWALGVASNAIRKWCGGHWFTRKTWTELYEPTLDGYIRLNQTYINQILAVQDTLETAITITNLSPSVQVADVYFSTSGDVETGQIITGLLLSQAVSGISTRIPIAYTTNMTINALATAINLTSGWQAVPETELGAWPVTELTGGLISQGAGIGTDGAKLKVYSRYLTDTHFHPDDGQKTGMIWVGRKSSGFGPRWGPYPFMDDDVSTGDAGLVKVTYDAGFNAIPSVVQHACVELVKALLIRLSVDPYLASESADAYSYTLADKMLNALPAYVREGLAQYRIHNA